MLYHPDLSQHVVLGCGLGVRQCRVRELKCGQVGSFVWG